MPGERSGEGSEELFKHIQKDERRKAGVTPRPFEPDTPPADPAGPADRPR